MPAGSHCVRVKPGTAWSVAVMSYGLALAVAHAQDRDRGGRTVADLAGLLRRRPVEIAEVERLGPCIMCATPCPSSVKSRLLGAARARMQNQQQQGKSVPVD